MTDIARTAERAPAEPPAKNTKPRDVRLDFFRGLCLVIIFIAHVPINPWAQWIPARFGFSDATEIFVFCSGMASAIAFGAIYRYRGFLLGTGRVMFRCWQVYWSHIGVFLVVTASMVVVDWVLGTGDAYVKGINLDALFGPHAKEAVVGLLTLQYVPNYFDILPMYLVILCLLPIVVGLHRLSPLYAVGFVVLLWLFTLFGLTDLPAEPWGDKTWYFNPFGWQLVFFTGFALMSGWLPAPAVDQRLIWSAVAVIVLTVPLAWQPLLEHSATLTAIRKSLYPVIDKNHFGLFRYIHFLSLAYLAYVAVGANGHRLKGPVVEVFRRLGQQSLAIFMAGLFLSFLAGVALNLLGRTVWTVALVNLAGIACLFAIARVTAWFKAQPWLRPPQPIEGRAPTQEGLAPAASTDVEGGAPTPVGVQPAE